MIGLLAVLLKSVQAAMEPAESIPAPGLQGLVVKNVGNG